MSATLTITEENYIETIECIEEEINTNESNLDINFAIKESDKDEKEGRISRNMSVADFWKEIGKGNV